ncbi:MAG: fimbrial biogenesis outer membrane usher protein [Bauldia sp.]|nr:fimbrial biogenesis outer membrane usher protein [Bauldia sp.]
MRRSSSRAARTAALLCGLLAAGGAWLVTRSAAALDLYLEVFVDGTSSALIAAFQQEPGGAFMVDPDDLRSVGLVPDPAAIRADGMIDIARLPGVTYRYDAAAQTMNFSVVPEARVATVLDGMRGHATPAPEGEPARAFILNYALSATLASHGVALSAVLEPRLSGGFGTLTAGFEIAPGSGRPFARLDTTFTRSDPERMMTLRAGDFITGGLDWTRPVRLAGIQVQRNFGLRPDLVTFPVPEFAGTAAVPSTVEVYINGIRRFAEEIPAGPFSIDRVPLPTGAGEAHLILRDGTGAETVTGSPFFASKALLAPGLVDFSIEAGFPRLGFGATGSNYRLMPAASATVRWGLTDRLTFEGHAETTAGLALAGVGAVAQLGHLGLVSGSVATSRAGGATGFRLSATADVSLGPVALQLGTWRTFGTFNDIGTVTSSCASGCGGGTQIARNHASLALPVGPTSVSLAYTRLVTTTGESRLLAGTFSTGIARRSSIYATAFAEFGGDPSFGAFAGFSMPLGENARSSVAARQTDHGLGVTTAVTGGRQDSPLSWTIRNSEGASPDRSAALTYAAPFARFGLTAGFDGSGAFGTVAMSGAMVAAGGGLFFVPRIEDGFAIIDAGMPGVDVFLENRPAGTTNDRGIVLLTGLRSYEANTVTIDPINLPPTATMAWTTATLVPGQGGGVMARFEVDEGDAAAIVILRDARGDLVRPGASAQLEGASELFLVGYDGIAYVTGLGASNRLLVQQADGSLCAAEFAFAHAAGAQVTIEAICLPEAA